MDSRDIKNGIRELLDLVTEAIDARHEEGWTTVFLDKLKDTRITLTHLDNDFK